MGYVFENNRRKEMSPNTMVILVNGFQLEDGSFQKSLSTSDKPIGDVFADTKEDFFQSAAKAVHNVHPDRSVRVQVKMLDGDVVQSRTFQPKPIAA